MSVLDRIEENLQEFQAQYPEIRRQRMEIAALKDLAMAKGDHGRLSELQDLMHENQAALEDWYSTKDKIDYVIGLVNKVPGVEWQPLGAPPVLLIGALGVAAAAALTAMTLVINKTVQMKMQLDGIKEGWLTPEEAQGIAKASGAGLGVTLGGVGVGTLLVGVGLLWLLSRK